MTNDIPEAAPPTTKVLSRLHRLEGQVRGVGHMVDSGAPCLDVLTQLAAVITWLGQSQALLVGRAGW